MMTTEGQKALRFAFVVLSSSLAAGCASVANTHPARPINANGMAAASSQTASGLAVSGEELEEVSSSNFGVLAVTFENPTNEWMRIDSVDLDFGNETRNQNVLIPWGEQITSWELATSQRLAIRRLNTAHALGLLAIGGGIAAGVGRGSAVGATGGLVALGSIGAMVGNGMNDSAAAVAFPPAHLFATPFSVPPGLFSKKWVLLSGNPPPQAGCISSVRIGYEVAGKGREAVFLPFSRSGSEWQRAACRPGG